MNSMDEEKSDDLFFEEEVDETQIRPEFLAAMEDVLNDHSKVIKSLED